MLIPFEDKDFLTSARNSVTEQFKSKQVFDRYLQLLISSSTSVQEQIKKLIQERSIDEAVGAQLDIIGRIVGQPRELVSLSVYKYFAFKGFANGDTYGDVNDPSVGGVFYTEGTPIAGNYRLDDSTYRLFIKSKILKNKTASTPEELIQFLTYIFGGNTPIYLREGASSITIFFGRQLSSLELNLLSFVSFELGYPSKLVPKTLGVGVEYAYFRGNNFFAFQGVPNAKGFGDKNELEGFGSDWDEDWGSPEGSASSSGGYFASYLDIV